MLLIHQIWKLQTMSDTFQQIEKEETNRNKLQALEGKIQVSKLSGTSQSPLESKSK